MRNRLSDTTLKASAITPKALFERRREFLRATVRLTASVAGVTMSNALVTPTVLAAKLSGYTQSAFDPKEPLTPLDKITAYNNFYEFGTDKEDPARHSSQFKPQPWQVEISGAIAKPAIYDLDDLLKPHALEERIYRLRCVEAWSMVIPWIGVPLGAIIKRLEPLPSAKFVAFTTVMRPTEMPGQQQSILEWPYREGLRIDEAMHPLTLLAVGLYGETLPNQNGAPLRLVVPWKYGFKNIKSIVKIHFTESMPQTTWNMMAPREYGFYANVNPDVDHPRWSQNKERRIGDFFKRDTLPFNGYADQVAGLYTGMDLHRNF